MVIYDINYETSPINQVDDNRTWQRLLNYVLLPEVNHAQLNDKWNGRTPRTIGQPK